MSLLNLEEALSLVHLYAAADDPRFDRAATRCSLTRLTMRPQ